VILRVNANYDNISLKQLVLSNKKGHNYSTREEIQQYGVIRYRLHLQTEANNLSYTIGYTYILNFSSII
jgi:hypothetical protein